MPELPDLEVVEDILTPRIVGRMVRGVEVNRSDLVRTGVASADLLVGRQLTAVERRGQFLLFVFGADAHLVVHLGRWAWAWHGPQGYVPTTATDLRLTLDDGTDLRLIEGRSPRLAEAWVVRDLRAVRPLQALGLEPLSDRFTAEALQRLIGDKHRPLKRLLTDPSLIAGIGSSYADEVLFQAKLSPVRYTHTLTPDEVGRLWQAIGTRLRQAIVEIRARVGDHLLQHEVQEFLSVHGRKGAPCPDCGTSIAEILYDDVRTNYCPHCQRAGSEPALGSA